MGSSKHSKSKMVNFGKKLNGTSFNSIRPKRGLSKFIVVLIAFSLLAAPSQSAWAQSDLDDWSGDWRPVIYNKKKPLVVTPDNQIIIAGTFKPTRNGNSGSTVMFSDTIAFYVPDPYDKKIKTMSCVASPASVQMGLNSSDHNVQWDVETVLIKQQYASGHGNKYEIRVKFNSTITSYSTQNFKSISYMCVGTLVYP